VGLLRGVLKQSVDIGTNLPGEDVSEAAFVASLQLDKLASVAFPEDGWTVSASLFNSNPAIGADDDYTEWDIRGTTVKSYAKHIFSLSGVANGSLNGDLSGYAMNSWGGFLRQSRYGDGQLLGESLIFGRLMYYQRLVNYQAFDGLYAGFSLEAGKMGDPLMAGINSGVITSASVFVATDSPIGPLYLGYGIADDGNDSFYLFIGYPY
jgi:NTE family protein